MLKNITDVMNNINTNEIDAFVSKTDSTIMLNADIKETKVDYGWLSILEDTLPAVDKIVRNPRRFIVQEEDVLIVEKTKRVSQETIKHLANHAENIQDIDEKGDVVPKKLLNVFKEDTSDLYENRFIYTLVKRLENFMNRQLELLDYESTKEIKKEVSYKAKTEIDRRKINIELKMYEDSSYNLLDDEHDYRKRIAGCFEIIAGFKSTEMIKELIGCSLVTNPIRKTNLILRQPDFQKAHLLWQYLDNFEYKDPKVVSYEKITNTTKELKDEFNLAYYVTSNAINEKAENLMQYKDIDAKLDKLLDEYVYEDDADINKFLEKSKVYFENSLKEKKEREKKIIDIYNNFINTHKNNLTKIEEIVN